jgi:hypothetical protein
MAFDLHSTALLLCCSGDLRSVACCSLLFGLYLLLFACYSSLVARSLPVLSVSRKVVALLLSLEFLPLVFILEHEYVTLAILISVSASPTISQHALFAVSFSCSQTCLHVVHAFFLLLLH